MLFVVILRYFSNVHIFNHTFKSFLHLFIIEKYNFSINKSKIDLFNHFQSKKNHKTSGLFLFLSLRFYIDLNLLVYLITLLFAIYIIFSDFYSKNYQFFLINQKF